MNRDLLQKLSQLRLQEAQVLFKNNEYSGAYYLAGYAVECALKSCIAKQTGLHDFPDKKFVIECHTHDLSKLVKLAQLDESRITQMQHDPLFAQNWAITIDWSETSRYVVIGEVQASQLLKSINPHDGGILQWLHQYW